MNLELDLEIVESDDRDKFINYIIKQIQKEILNQFDERRVYKIENYINNNKIIDFIIKDKYVKVRDIYITAVYNLIVQKLDDNKFNIITDKNKNIADSNTSILSVLKLLEYGNLDVNKYGLLTKIMEDIARNINTYFKKYKLGVE